LRPAAIIDALNLRRPIYKQTAAYGHFGRTDVDLPWEHLDRVDEIKKYFEDIKVDIAVQFISEAKETTTA
ncbi:MAG: methionine adenosyltransferase domain-containing protein, partial [Pseudobutyrivibrio sp.]|uniref:methionine adenosyltransferase domain-containing protein n=1 Tax=Pseudobutyrivibrio sp. TaxID=2014367 RepID=UPI0025F6424C